MSGYELDIPKAMKTLRLKLDMTQGDIFRLTGLERPYISKMEAGMIIPKLKTIVKLAKAFRMSPSEFIKYAEVKIK